MKEREVAIGLQLGLHARAAAQLVRLAARYRSEIVLVRDDVRADARSILSILLLAARCGATVQVRAHGADEEEALDKVCEYLSG